MNQLTLKSVFPVALFAVIGVFQLTTSGQLSVSEGSLPTISQLQAEMKGHLDKSDGRLEKVENPTLEKTMNPILFKENTLSTDLF